MQSSSSESSLTSSASTGAGHTVVPSSSLSSLVAAAAQLPAHTMSPDIVTVTKNSNQGIKNGDRDNSNHSNEHSRQRHSSPSAQDEDSHVEVDACLPAAAAAAAAAEAAAAASTATDAVHFHFGNKIDMPRNNSKMESVSTCGCEGGNPSCTQRALAAPAPAPAPAPVAAAPALPAAPAGPVSVVLVKPPAECMLALIRASVYKANLPLFRMFVLALMSGLYLGFALLLTLIVAGSLTETLTTTASMPAQQMQIVLHNSANETTTGTAAAGAVQGQFVTTFPEQPGYVKFVAGGVFPFGLILITILGAELFTGNMMTFGVGLLAGKVTIIDTLRNWGVVYVGNWLGIAAFCYVSIYLPEYCHFDPVRSFLFSTCSKKVTTGWGIILLKAIGCNWMVAVAIWSGIMAEDFTGKVVACWWPIFAFAAIGFEHSIANMGYLSLALMENAPGMNLGDVLGRNIVPVTIGNFLGAMCFLFSMYYLYAPATSPQIPVSARKKAQLDAIAKKQEQQIAEKKQQPETAINMVELAKTKA